MEGAPTVYIMASRPQGSLYIGVTSELIKRVWEHRTGKVPGFTRRYGVKCLVWFEQHDAMETAIYREKRLKRWRRAWKIELIEASNPEWQDLYPGLL